MKPRDHQWMGFRRDQRDARDHIFDPGRGAIIPEVIELRQFCPPVLNQKSLGSCTAHGITEALRFGFKKTGQPDIPLSRLQLYYHERQIEGTISSDAGAEIRDGIKSTQKDGIAPEVDWPYIISKYRTKPSAKAARDAIKFAFRYERVTVDTDHLRAALARGWPVIIGVSLFKSFDNEAVSATGMVPMPDPRESDPDGHCMLVVGAGQKANHFTVRNSWDTDWGDKGDCYIPYDYLGSTKFGSDYWQIHA
jgi:C1A family cysteine protease